MSASMTSCIRHALHQLAITSLIRIPCIFGSQLGVGLLHRQWIHLSTVAIMVLNENRVVRDWSLWLQFYVCDMHYLGRSLVQLFWWCFFGRLLVIVALLTPLVAFLCWFKVPPLLWVPWSNIVVVNLR
jgi:hypothetical protein